VIANRELSPEEKEKHRQWQMDEILRRRGRTGHPFVEPGAMPEPKPGAVEYKCPECGTPFRNPKYRRCYGCHPARRVGLDEAFARPKGPVIVPATEAVAVVEADSEPEYSPPIPEREPRIPEYSAPSRNIDAPVAVPEPVVDHSLRSQEMVTPDPIDALRLVVDALDGLDEAAALWVLRSARRLPRGAGR
jgi:hypothetical protein